MIKELILVNVIWQEVIMSNNILELSSREEEIDSTMDNKGKRKSHKASPKKPRVLLTVLDPRYKLQCVQWGYKRIYGDSVEYELEFSKILMIFVAMNSEMDMYYEEPLMPRSSNIDILAYWRTCSVRYPVLAQMAKDVLSVPVSNG
uniref:HAT C-terminal dimerisation domain-containing protein n=1 Tax=Chenopodium quinoa TaxID=63459 RepID=A0A803LR75_CHEQI